MPPPPGEPDPVEELIAAAERTVAAGQMVYEGIEARERLRKAIGKAKEARR
jgi:hypothetical protein